MLLEINNVKFSVLQDPKYMTSHYKKSCCVHLSSNTLNEQLIGLYSAVADGWYNKVTLLSQKSVLKSIVTQCDSIVR